VSRLWLVCLLVLGGCLFDRGGVAPAPVDAAATGSDAVPDVPFDLMDPDGGTPGLGDSKLPASDATPLDTAALDTKPSPDTKPPPDTFTGVLHTDDFDTWGFTPTSAGTWGVDGGLGELSVCGSSVAHAMVPGKSWGDVKVSVKLRADSGCNAGQIGLRVRIESLNPCRLYTCVVSIPMKLIGLSKKSSSCGASAALSTQSANGVKYGTWYKMELEAVGKKLTCRLSGGNLSGTVTVSYTDNSNPIMSGSAGIGGYGVTGVFDEFRVEVP